MSDELRAGSNVQYYLLFYSYKDAAGGAEDFHSAHTDLEAAKQAGLAEWKDGNGLSSWMHLAVFDGHSLRIILTMIIPDTEWTEDEDAVLEWREVEV